MRIAPAGADPLAAASSMRARPSPRAPVPQSNTNRVPPSVRTSTQEVFPPYRTVSGPGVGTEPRVPQKRMRTNPVCPGERSEAGGPRSSLTVDDYFTRGPRPREWFRRSVTWHHRTVEDYVGALLDAGLQLQRLSECEPDSSLLAEDPVELARRRRVPLMLLLSAVCT